MAPWTIVSGLGPGGMGEVIRARETNPNRRVATGAVRAASRQRQRAAQGSNTSRSRWARRMLDALRQSACLSR